MVETKKHEMNTTRRKQKQDIDVFGYLDFDHLNLFRISSFEFRIYVPQFGPTRSAGGGLTPARRQNLAN